MLDNFDEFFQIYHPTDQPLGKQCKHLAVEKCKHKEVSWEKDVVSKRCNIFPLSVNNVQSSKHAWQEYYYCPYKSDWYKVLWKSCACQNWNHQDYYKPKGFTTNCPQHQAPQDHDGDCDRCNHCWSCTRSHYCDCHDCRVCDYKLQLLVTIRAKNILQTSMIDQSPALAILGASIISMATLFSMMTHSDKDGSLGPLVSFVSNKNKIHPPWA